MLRQTAIPLALLLSLASCATDPGRNPSHEGTNNPREAQTTTVTEDLNAPWSITFYGQTPLVSERDSARILELDDRGPRV